MLNLNDLFDIKLVKNMQKKLRNQEGAEVQSPLMFDLLLLPLLAVINCCKLLVSGLVDAHTHPVWAGDRVHEFAMKVNYSV